MGDSIGKFTEPIHKYTANVLELLVADLKVIPIQRKASKPHIARLVRSIKTVGFVVPVIVVKRAEQYYIIDGQHRFLAAVEAGAMKIPAIEVPEKFAHNLMELNVEKTMNLRDKCYVALNVYRMYMKEAPEVKETDGQITDSIETPHFISIGLTYERDQRFSGTSFEPLLKKVDAFLDLDIMKGMQERERRADDLIATHKLVGACSARVRQIGISHPFIYKEIVSFCNPAKRQRKVADDFYKFFEKVRENLKELIKSPEKIRRHTFGAESESTQI